RPSGGLNQSCEARPPHGWMLALAAPAAGRSHSVRPVLPATASVGQTRVRGFPDESLERGQDYLQLSLSSFWMQKAYPGSFFRLHHNFALLIIRNVTSGRPCVEAPVP